MCAQPARGPAPPGRLVHATNPARRRTPQHAGARTRLSTPEQAHASARRSRHTSPPPRQGGLGRPPPRRLRRCATAGTHPAARDPQPRPQSATSGAPARHPPRRSTVPPDLATWLRVPEMGETAPPHRQRSRRRRHPATCRMTKRWPMQPRRMRCHRRVGHGRVGRAPIRSAARPQALAALGPPRSARARTHPGFQETP